jgi:DHA2 family multidrug resistance protein
MIGAMSFVLYSGAVLLPQFSQQVIGYTATHAGLIMSPGGVVVIFLIPIITRFLPRLPTRYLIGTGFFIMGLSLLYSSRLVPQVTYFQLALMRMAQSAGLAFLFVPVSVLAYSTVPRRLNGDAAAMYTMFRNVIGSIGITTATSLVQQRTQVRQAHLADWMTPLNQPFNNLLQQTEAVRVASGDGVAGAHAAALGEIYRTFQTQASIMAYNDVFRIFAVASFCIVPLTFLFTNYKPAPGARPGAAH